MALRPGGSPRRDVGRPDFGSISALFGLTNHIIDQQQYTFLVTAVIGSAVAPTLIARLIGKPLHAFPDAL